MGQNLEKKYMSQNQGPVKLVFDRDTSIDGILFSKFFKQQINFKIVLDKIFHKMLDI